MRTISTLCASGAGISIAAVGLAVVREEATSSDFNSSRNPTPSDQDMTAVAAYPHSANLTSPFALSTTPPPAARPIGEGSDGKSRSAHARVGQKRTLTPRTSFSAGMDRPLERENGGRSQAATPDAQPHSWLRRLSSSLASSREHTSSPTSRPGSAAVSQSNGSAALSYADSATPMFTDRIPQTLPPNKLVKRSSSLRSSNSSPFQPNESRIPVPVLRRPATSHQRSATLQEMYTDSDKSDRMSLDGHPSSARVSQTVQYFTPRVRSEELSLDRRRSSTGIPTPIRRVYPDRRYKPVLMLANSEIRRARSEIDDSVSEEEGAGSRLAMVPSHASSPLPQQFSSFDEGQTPRRSFSIGDLLSTGPQQLWRRPSLGRGKSTGSKLVRRNKGRVVSAPHAAMGGALSRTRDADSERPAKRRDLTDPTSAARSIYSTTSSPLYQGSSISHEVDLGLASVPPHSVNAMPQSFPGADDPQVQRSSPLEQRRQTSGPFFSATVRPARTSVAPSEVPSTVDSESEYRSIGDASTDYQSDNVYDSFPTRTTRSSSGKRGPHIETIFDDSPPTFSSGRSTRLKDILGEGSYAQDDFAGRYRHSTIEEEGSIMSTPVRSVHDKSVTSTPSTHIAQRQLFTSSPPALGAMADPDDIDWDAPDDEPMHGTTDTPQALTPGIRNGTQQSLPFRFGPVLSQQTPTLAGSTPLRQNAGDKTNLFEWSEVQPSPSNNDSPPRPRTVHGKKDQEARGSRAAGRRAPSGMHARSHSVPVVPDVEGKRSSAVANKFGTWGQGSKAVTEDWNEDFDFDELPTSIPEQVLQTDERTDSGREMFVPKSIREQQENVMSNIRLLREWGLLIEELKELRIRAITLHMLDGPSAAAWQEVDAMIDLADQETEESTLEPRKSPPSSPGFDYNDFEDSERPTAQEAGRVREESLASIDALSWPDDAQSAPTDQRPTTPQENNIVRPRKDSEAVARSVIEAIQSKRSVSEPTTLRPVPSGKKVPFDTATLRHIVPYVKDLKRKVKDALRVTEGLYSSPHRRQPSILVTDEQSLTDFDEPPASLSIFTSPSPEELSANRRSRREPALTDHDGDQHDDFTAYNGADMSADDRRTDLAKQMEDMNLPR